MNKSARLLVLSGLAAIAFSVGAQGLPPAPPPGAPDRQGMMQRSWGDPSAADRERWREERRERRDAWQHMSPEERHRLRRDIRDAGQAIYPRHGLRGRD
jgi:hypothetical protein